MKKVKKRKQSALVILNKIERRILDLRGQKVMLDCDLAEIYGVTTKRLNEQVKRNIDRFPGDFMFKLTARELSEVVAICDHLANLKFSYQAPFAFTEHGALMLASVLNSEIAVSASLEIVRTFIKMRSVILSNSTLSKKLDSLELRLSKHDENLK